MVCCVVVCRCVVCGYPSKRFVVTPAVCPRLFCISHHVDSQGTSSTPSARSSNKARTKRAWRPPPRHLSFRSCACSRDAAGSWSFRTVSKAQSSPNGPVPRSAPAGCPPGTLPRSPLQAHPHWCTTMTGAVDVPTFPQFATGDACSRRSLSQDTEGACWGFRFRRVRRISIP